MKQGACIQRSTAEARGFTLIEVVVAVAILGWVLVSAVSMVSQYADERVRMRERFLGNQVAWNQLMEEYRSSRGWQSSQSGGLRSERGQAQQAGQNWVWSVQVQPTLGSGLYQYRVTTAETEDSVPVAGLTAYFAMPEGTQ